MTHLTRDEQVLALDGALPPRRRAHLDRCARCRDEVAALEAVLRAVRKAPVPEPSPLFWDHFSARVREAIAAEPVPVRQRWTLPRWRLALAGSAVIAILAVIVVLRLPGRAPRSAAGHRDATAVASAPGATGSVVASTPAADDDGTGADESWGVLLALADETPLTDEEALALPSRPGQAELAATELSDEEREALVALLNEAIAAPTARRAS